MSRKYFILLGLFLVAGFLFLNVNAVNAALFFWDGGGDGTTWTDPNNWVGNSNYPGKTITDQVVIASSTTGGQVTVRATSTLAGSLEYVQLGAVSTSFGSNAATLILGNDATVAASSSVILIGTSTLRLGDSSWGSGTLLLSTSTPNANPIKFGTTTTAFYSATGTVTFTGTGGDIVIATTTYYNLTLTPTSTTATRTYNFSTNNSTCAANADGCTATTTISNALTVNLAAQADFGTVAIVLSGSGTAFSKSNGTFLANGALVQYTNASAATDIATGTYDNLVISGAVVKSLTASTTATSTMRIASGATLAVGNNTLTVIATSTNNGTLTIGASGVVTATGATWTNTGTVTETSGGKIVFAAVMVVSNSAGGAAVSEFGNADTNPVVHVQVTDVSLDFLAASADNPQTAVVTATSMITDAEVVTLTETGANTGIFRGQIAFQSSGTDVAGVLDYQGGGSLSITFTDSQDTADTESGTGNFTGSAPGGGGGGTVTVVVVTPAVPATPATPAVPTETPAVPATPATPAVPAAPSLDDVSTKIASVVTKIAALTKDSPAADIAAVQAEIVAILNDIKAIQAASPAPAGVALGFNFVRPLALGLRHADVTKLQEALKTDSSVYPEGTVSGYFGPLTLRAVQKFQEKYGIASSGIAGYGNVGPKTREKLNSLYGK